MVEGKIISFFREKKQLTQRDIGMGICSSSHVSKIERGLTEYSTEVVKLLADRLQVDLEREKETYYTIKSLLHQWMEAILLRQEKKAKQLKRKLEGYELLELPEFQRTYMLIHIRYSMLLGEFSDVPLIMKETEKEENLSDLDVHLLLHNKAICLLYFDRDYEGAKVLLRQIDDSMYPYHEYYYHLALSHYFLGQHILAYKYVSKSLDYFMKTHNFSRIIDAEMLILIQLEQDSMTEYKEDKYQSLLEMSETYGLQEQQSIILHNYAYHQFVNQHYLKAMDLYRRAMSLKDPNSKEYLGSLEGYIHAASKSSINAPKKLLKWVEEGLEKAKKLGDERSLHLLTLHQFKILNQLDDYYQYLESTAYPYFSINNMKPQKEYYQIQLYHYFVKNGQMEKANLLSRTCIESIEPKHQYV
ncbi:hypothetical protein AWM68_12870 [Fictibacillus phosphorivorans]|uniref:HTH cro/C1-type domain-containing protein n=1 Tax=Fictibacillus phosphorivorans TaxID=1221500 RepID=A0A163PR97_9BACL|nr:helix-turn-helix transcriptional regulator [Fictibacillus phosphorivorans]KZE63998.1 hypothetical protein AWM68_12870 [Fictibacillus phosphorivorans]